VGLGWGFPWSAIVIAAWGIGLVAHYFTAYRKVGRNWIEKETEKVEREIEKEERRT
jgi:hypothetical protein